MNTFIVVVVIAVLSLALTASADPVKVILTEYLFAYK